ncbi:MAG: zinc ribbon domain-containing protein [Bacteroidetes bacterium]|nr:zinc ribbon domain-containing protein [Bacteroidota bacterium]
MPTYVYRREDGTTFELVQRITDDALTEDPESGQKVERVISGGIGLQFKGTGFYITDYARAGSGSETTNGEAKSESSSEAKPKSKSKSKSKPESKNTDASTTSKD